MVDLSYPSTIRASTASDKLLFFEVKTGAELLVDMLLPKSADNLSLSSRMILEAVFLPITGLLQ